MVLLYHMGSSQHFDGKHFQFRIIRTKMVCIEKQMNEIKKKSHSQFHGVVTLNVESRSRKKGLQPQPQTCTVKKDQCPARRAWCLQASPCSTAPFPFTFRILGRQSTMTKCWLETIIGQSTRFVLVCLPCNLKLFVLQTRNLKDSVLWPSHFERKSAQFNGDWTTHSYRLTVVRDVAVMRP